MCKNTMILPSKMTQSRYLMQTDPGYTDVNGISFLNRSQLHKPDKVPSDSVAFGYIPVASNKQYLSKIGSWLDSEAE